MHSSYNHNNNDIIKTCHVFKAPGSIPRDMRVAYISEFPLVGLILDSDLNIKFPLIRHCYCAYNCCNKSLYVHCTNQDGEHENYDCEAKSKEIFKTFNRDKCIVCNKNLNMNIYTKIAIQLLQYPYLYVSI